MILRFSRTRGWDGWLIRTALWSKINHVDVVLPGGSRISAFNPEGVAIKPMPAPGVDAHEEFYHVPLPGLRAVKIYATLRAEVGKPYDKWGVIGIGVQRDWSDSARWFCSELIAHAFLANNVPILQNRPPTRVTPRDLHQSSLLERIQYR